MSQPIAPSPRSDASLTELLARAEMLLQSQPEAAAEATQAALRLSPLDPRANHIAAELQGVLGEPEAGAARLRQLVQQHGKLAELGGQDDGAVAYIGRFGSAVCPLCGGSEAEATWAGNLSRTQRLDGHIDPVRLWTRCNRCELLRVDNPVPAGALAAHNTHDTAAATPPEPDELQRRIRTHDADLRRIREAGCGLAWSTDGQHSGPRVLELGSGWGEFLAAAAWRGFEATGVQACSIQAAWAERRLGSALVHSPPDTFVHDSEQEAGTYEVVVWRGDLGEQADLMPTLRALRRLLAPEGMLMVQASVLDHPLHRIKGNAAPEWRSVGRRVWFERPTLALALIRAGLQPESSWDAEGCAGEIVVLARASNPDPA